MDRNRTFAAIAIALASSAQAGTLSSTPQFPVMGDTVALVLSGEKWPTYLPTASYARSGNTFTFDFDTTSNHFGQRPDRGTLPIAVGQLPPGTYTAHARVSSLEDPAATPRVETTYFTVAPPWTTGAYATPAQPTAYNTWTAIVSSGYYVYPQSLKVTLSPGLVRIAFEYAPGASTSSGSAPTGTSAYASVPVEGIAPGQYMLEFSGTPRGGSGDALQYRAPLSVLRHSVVAEYYNDATGHYFISGGPGEMAGLDAPGSGWRRTGEQFHAYLGEVPPDTVPVCRFYASGPNSHFYTADGGECTNLKAIEMRERAGGKAFNGWTYEGVAFHARLPVDGACDANSDPVYRFYNNRWKENDSNHRFPASVGMRAAMMATSWTSEGIAFCSPR